MSSSTSTAPSVGSLLAQLAGAIVGGALVAIAAYFAVGYALLPLELGMGLLSIQLFAVIIGFGAGAGLGAAAAGRITGRRGSWWAGTLAGALTGVIVILVMRLLNVGGLGALLGVGVSLVLIAALAGYNLVRR